MLTCKDAARLISEEIDHKLPLSKRLGLRVHLIMCNACNNYRQQLSGLKILTSHYAKKPKKNLNTSSVSLSSQAKHRIKQILRKKNG